tara:strand:+ start:61 stop:708 length:648 start_codon:yes stop_codon:yes gene_type:complete
MADEMKTWGTSGSSGGVGKRMAKVWGIGPTTSGQSVSRSAQQDALGSLAGKVDTGRQAVLGAYDDAIRSRQNANAEAIRQMRMGLAAPAAGTLAGSGAAGLLGSGAAQASARQAALQAGLQRDQMMQTASEQEAAILRQRAAQQLGFAQEDIQAAQQRMTDITDRIEASKDTYPKKNDFIRYATQQRDAHPPGSMEYEAWNNEIILVEPNWYYTS